MRQKDLMCCSLLFVFAIFKQCHKFLLGFRSRFSIGHCRMKHCLGLVFVIIEVSPKLQGCFFPQNNADSLVKSSWILFNPFLIQFRKEALRIAPIAIWWHLLLPSYSAIEIVFIEMPCNSFRVTAVFLARICLFLALKFEGEFC